MNYDEKKSGGGWLKYVLIGCSGCLVLVVGGCAAIVFVGLNIMKSSEPYQQALEKVRQDLAVIEKLGEPISDGWYVAGNFEISDESGTVSIFFPISGPKGSGRVFVDAVKTSGQWTFTHLVVEIEGSGEKIVLVQPAAEKPVELEEPAAPASEVLINPEKGAVQEEPVEPEVLVEPVPAP